MFFILLTLSNSRLFQVFPGFQVFWPPWKYYLKKIQNMLLLFKFSLKFSFNNKNSIKQNIYFYFLLTVSVCFFNLFPSTFTAPRAARCWLVERSQVTWSSSSLLFATTTSLGETTKNSLLLNSAFVKILAWSEKK